MDLSEKLSSVLNDPASMAKIAELAKELAPQAGASPSPAPPEATPESVPYLQDLARFVGRGGRERTALLSSLRPYLKREKRARLDRILTVLNALNIVAAMQPEGGRERSTGEN